jgi:hypothetical protein
MSVGINITDASRDLIISVGHNITHRPYNNLLSGYFFFIAMESIFIIKYLP